MQLKLKVGFKKERINVENNTSVAQELIFLTLQILFLIWHVLKQHRRENCLANTEHLLSAIKKNPEKTHRKMYLEG